MHPSKRGRVTTVPKIIQEIKETSSKKGVTVILDFNPDSNLSNMGSMYSYDSKSKILTLCAPNLSREDKPFLLEYIRSIHEEGEFIWKESKNDGLSSVKKYSEENKDAKILQFFSSLISTDDSVALKMSLFLRNQAKLKKDITAYKQDIVERFGSRGSNISNLCSAGYFEQLMNSYNDSEHVEFMKYYDLVVGKRAKALFVNTHMKPGHLKKQIEEMVKKAEHYHTDNFRIHGIGAANVSTIKTAISQIGGEVDYIIRKTFESKSAIEYVVEITR